MNAGRVWPLVLLAGCGFGHQDRERQGDEAWHAGKWADAVADYTAAGESPVVEAKIADASLQGGMLTESARAWTKLGAMAPERAGEAAAGLARVADAAEQSGKIEALAQSIIGLRQVSPGWPLGRLASRLGVAGGMPPFDAGQIIPALLAATPTRGQADAMMVTLARADRSLGACAQAVPILEGVLRRSTTTELRDSAATTLGWCRLGLGLAALEASHPGEAERWLDGAAQQSPDSAVSRRALIGLGDAKLRQGDSASARVAWESVATSPVPPDTLTQLALLRIRQLDPSVAGDSGALPSGRPQ